MGTFQVGVFAFITVRDEHTQTQGYTVCRVQASGDTWTKASAKVYVINSKAISTLFFNKEFSPTWLLFLVSTYDS